MKDIGGNLIVKNENGTVVQASIHI
jgi:hypothetical protein